MKLIPLALAGLVALSPALSFAEPNTGEKTGAPKGEGHKKTGKTEQTTAKGEAAKKEAPKHNKKAHHAPAKPKGEGHKAEKVQPHDGAKAHPHHVKAKAAKPEKEHAAVHKPKKMDDGRLAKKN
jgi:hypothetical protein